MLEEECVIFYPKKKEKKERRRKELKCLIWFRCEEEWIDVLCVCMYVCMCTEGSRVICLGHPLYFCKYKPF